MLFYNENVVQEGVSLPQKLKFFLLCFWLWLCSP